MSEDVGSHPGNRIRLFVDYWNLQLTLNERQSAFSGTDARFEIDWQKLPAVLAARCAVACGLSDYRYEGASVFASYNPRSSKDKNFKHWITTWLDRQPGVQVVLKERQPRGPPRCQHCHRPITDCPHCGTKLAGTVEKGVDTAIVTDMIRLAWEQAYDVAVLASSDSDLVPAVQFLDMRGRKVVQAGFPPSGSHLATACWASFDLFAERRSFQR